MFSLSLSARWYDLSHHGLLIKCAGQCFLWRSSEQQSKKVSVAIAACTCSLHTSQERCDLVASL